MCHIWILRLNFPAVDAFAVDDPGDAPGCSPFFSGWSSSKKTSDGMNSFGFGGFFILPAFSRFPFTLSPFGFGWIFWSLMVRIGVIRVISGPGWASVKEKACSELAVTVRKWLHLSSCNNLAEKVIWKMDGMELGKLGIEHVAKLAAERSFHWLCLSRQLIG